MPRPSKSAEEKRESAACRKRRFNERKASEGRRQYNSWIMWPKDTEYLVVVRCCGNCPEEILKGDIGLQLKFDEEGKISIKRIKFGMDLDKPPAVKPAFKKPVPAVDGTPAGPMPAESASGQQDHTGTVGEVRNESAAGPVVIKPVAEPEPVADPKPAEELEPAGCPVDGGSAEAPACAKPKRTFPPGWLEPVEYDEFDVSLVDERIGEQSYSRRIGRLQDGLRAFDGGLVFNKVWGKQRQNINDLDKDIEKFISDSKDADRDDGKYMKWQLYNKFYSRWNEADKDFTWIEDKVETMHAQLLAGERVSFPVYPI